MVALQSTPPATTVPSDDLMAPVADLAGIREVVRRDLAPKVSAIDRDGEYPAAVMHQLGTAGAFRQAVAREYGGAGVSLKGAVQAIEAVSEECLSTGFITWCQIACTWYLQNTPNRSLAASLLPGVARGETMAATGLSNPMKFFAGIEKLSLRAERVDGGYVLDGQLPWVSNLGPGHYFGVVAQLGDTGKHMMAIASDAMAGVTLRRCGEFVALEGTGTYACVFRRAFVPDASVLASPCEAYIDRIRPGFVLTQVGMGLGLARRCIDLMQRYERRLGHVNSFLDDRPAELRAELETARRHTYRLAEDLQQVDGAIAPTLLREVVQARLTGAELSLKAAHSAMLHAGARAYLRGSAEERKLREAYFVAIVTPAIKQLKKMLSALNAAV